MRSTAASPFIIKLLSPVAGVFDIASADVGLTDELMDIREAQLKVAALTLKRDACPWGSRDRAVQQIMLDWWTKELCDLCGGLAA